MGRGAKPGHDFFGNQYTGGINNKNTKKGSQGQVEGVIAAVVISAAAWGIKKGVEAYNKIKK